MGPDKHVEIIGGSESRWDPVLPATLDQGGPFRACLEDLRSVSLNLIKCKLDLWSTQEFGLEMAKLDMTVGQHVYAYLR